MHVTGYYFQKGMKIKMLVEFVHLHHVAENCAKLSSKLEPKSEPKSKPKSEPKLEPKLEPKS